MRESDKLETLLNMTKLATWERAKGALREFSAVHGSYPSNVETKWEEINERVEDFIREIEDDGLHD